MTRLRTIKDPDINAKPVCPSCGGDIVKTFRIEVNGRKPAARCLSCGNEYAPDSREYLNFFPEDFSIPAYQTILRTGENAVIDSVRYTLSGLARYSGQNGRTLIEWAAVSDEGRTAFIHEEHGRFLFFEIESTGNFSGQGDFIFNGKTFSKNSWDSFTILYSEGGKKMLPEAGETVLVSDFRKKNAFLRFTSYGGKVNILKGKVFSHKDLVSAFNIESAKRVYKDAALKKNRNFRKSFFYMITAILLLLCAASNYFSAEKVKGVSGSRSIISDNRTWTEGTEKIFNSSAVYGPFSIESGKNLYNIKISIDEKKEQLSGEPLYFRYFLIEEKKLADVILYKNDPVKMSAFFEDIDIMQEPVESYSFTSFLGGRGKFLFSGDRTNFSSTDFYIDPIGKYYGYIEAYRKKPLNIMALNIEIEKRGVYIYYLAASLLLFSLMMFYAIKGAAVKVSYYDLVYGRTTP